MRLIDADALIIDLMDAGLDQIQTGDCSEIIQIVERQPAASPWHRVEEELPDKNTNVLFYDENGHFHCGFTSRFRGYTEFIDYDGNTLHRITHWMPIEPPKEDA